MPSKRGAILVMVIYKNPNGLEEKIKYFGNYFLASSNDAIDSYL